MTHFLTKEDGNDIKHIILSKDVLSKIQGKIACTELGCLKVFTLVQNLELHVMQTHKHKKYKGAAEKDCEQRFYCPVENCIYQYHSNREFMKYFKKQKYVKQHYLKVHADRKFPCDMCEQSFSTTSYLTAHKVSCNQNIVCSCGKSFISIPSLQTHVRRMKHEAAILNLNGKKRKIPTIDDKGSDKFLQTSNAPSKRVTTAETKILEIQPKSQCSHMISAIALSELGVARFKRISTVDIGIQTENSSHKRSVKKLNSFIKEYNHSKLRPTIETETQTNLTHLKKRKKSRKMRSISTSSVQIGPINLIPDFTSNIASKEPVSIVEKIIQTVHPADIQEEESAPKHFSSQTNAENKYSIPYLDSAELINTSNPEETLDFYNFYQPVARGTQIGNIYPSKQQLEENSNNYVYQNIIGAIKIKQNVDLIENINSTSIETSTDHDMFLNSNLSILNGFTSSETQTDNCNLWCSSETQTCEDFSDIEQYLCSTIHTQTVESTDDLFPDLNFTDNYTQTACGNL